MNNTDSRLYFQVVFGFQKSSGARSFEESAIEAEEHWNECIKEVLWKGGFGAPSENLGGLGEFSLRVASIHGVVVSSQKKPSEKCGSLI